MKSSLWRTGARALSAAAAVAFAVTVVGVSPAIAAPPPTPIHDVVVVDPQGTPIDGAALEFSTASAFTDGPRGLTGPDGRLDVTTVQGLETGGVYTMWVWANGYAGYWDRVGNPGETAPVQLVTDKTTVTVKIDKTNGPPDRNSAGIAGTVTDALTGNPVAGIQVRAIDDSGSGTGEGSGAGQSKKDGTVYLNYSGEVFPSTAEVRFSSLLTTPDAPFGYEEQTYDGINASTGAPETPVDLIAGRTASGVNAALLPNGQLAGTVTEVTADGIAPLADVQISVWNTEGRFVVAGGNTAADGTYAFPVPAGSWAVQFDKIVDGKVTTTQFWKGVSTIEDATTVDVSPAARTAGIDAAFGTLAAAPPTPTETPATPAPTSSATAAPMLARTGTDDVLPLLLAAGGLAALGVAIIRRCRRTRSAR